MRHRYSIYFTILLLVSLVSQTYAVSDENICAEDCQFCCREKQCRSEDECKGNFQPFVILGIVAGALVALFVLRKVYLYLKQENAKKTKANSGKKSARQTRSKAKAPSKSKSKPSRSKSMKKEEKKSLKEEAYINVDGDSVISPDSSIVRNDQASQDLEKGNPKSDSNVKSKGEIKDNKENEKTEKQKEDKKKDMKASNVSGKTTTSKSDPKKGDKTKASSGASKKPGSSKPGTKATGDKERGRSAGRDDKKERSTSQKKGSVNKDGKKNQV